MDQRDHIGQMLVGIAGNVTAEDRRETCVHLEITKPTLCTYLQGRGPNSDLALSIFKFLKIRIERRGQIINSLCEHLKSA